MSSFDVNVSVQWWDDNIVQDIFNGVPSVESCAVPFYFLCQSHWVHRPFCFHEHTSRSTVEMAAARARSMNLPQTSSKSKPLRGYSFFFDGNDKDVKILEQKIAELGGKVDTFLSNKVNYFIRSNGVEKKQSAPRRSPRLTRNSQDTMSRSNKMVARAYAVAKEEGTVSLSSLQRAQKLGLSVHTVDKLAKWLNEFVETKTDQKRGKSTGASGKQDAKKTGNERELKDPFLKVTDRKRKYQPLYKELTVAPSVSFDSFPPQSPFERVTRSQVTLGKAPVTRANTRQGATKSRKGYCELCAVTFENREQHMKSAKHRDNITSKNFSTLDKLITRGRSFTSFVSNINQVPQNIPQKNQQASPNQEKEKEKAVKPRGRRSVTHAKIPRGARSQGRRDSDLSKAKDMSVREEKALQQSRSDITRTIRTAKKSVSFQVNLPLPSRQKRLPTKRRLFDDDDDDDDDENDDIGATNKPTRSQGPSSNQTNKRSRTVGSGSVARKVTKVTKGTKQQQGGVATRRTRSGRRSVVRK